MSTIDMRSFDSYSWLRHSAKCQLVHPGWKYSADSATLPLQDLAAAWAGVQQFMKEENLRNAQGFAYLLEKETLEQALQQAPAQTMGIRFNGGEYTVFTMDIMDENPAPFRNIRICPADIKNLAVQTLALLASGTSTRVEAYRCIPAGLSDMQTSIIHGLFDRLATVFRQAGFAVNLHPLTVEQIREDIQGFGPEFPSRHFVKLDRQNSSSSCSPTCQNPDLVWVNISRKKINDCAKLDTDYHFYCVSAEECIEVIYSIPAQQLLCHLRRHCSLINNEKWSCYVNFRTGHLCATVSGSSPLPLQTILKSQF